jgi:MFS family permease
LTQVIFSNIVLLICLPHYFAIVLGSWAVGSIIGPVLSGSLIQQSSWRWCFYINYPFCIVRLLGALLFVRPGDESSLPLLHRLGRMDWLGAILFMAGSTLCLVGVSWGGTQYPWVSRPTIASIATGIVIVILFSIWQSRLGLRSLLPTPLFKSKRMGGAFYCLIANGLVVSLPGGLSSPLLISL